MKTILNKISETLRDAFKLLAVTLVVGGCLILMSHCTGSIDPTESPRTASDVRTEQCERSYSNSNKVLPKSVFMDRCRADLKSLEGMNR